MFGIQISWKKYNDCRLQAVFLCDGQEIANIVLPENCNSYNVNSAEIRRDGKIEKRPIFFGEAEQVGKYLHRAEQTNNRVGI
jgi:hypothetical protein